MPRRRRAELRDSSANFSIVGLPSNHLPTTQSCEVCHTGTGSSVPTLPVPNGAKFSGSRMSHAGITNNCAACHGPTIGSGTFAGITRIVVMPPTRRWAPARTSHPAPPARAATSARWPTSAARSRPTPRAPRPARCSPRRRRPARRSTPASRAAATPATKPATWMGMASYPISPTVLTAGAQYHRLPDAAAPRRAPTTSPTPRTRPAATARVPHRHDLLQQPGQARRPHPDHHRLLLDLPRGGGRLLSGGLTTSMATLHTGISSGCASCHIGRRRRGPFAGCTTQATCASPPPITYQPKTMPLAAGGSPTAPSSQNARAGGLDALRAATRAPCSPVRRHEHEEQRDGAQRGVYRHLHELP